MDGIDLIRQLKPSLDFELVFVTSYQSKRIIDRAYGLNPANYIIKPLDENRLYTGVLSVIGKIQSSDEKNEAFKHWIIELLTPIEIKILQLIAQKKTTKEVAETLCLGSYTIKNYRHSICRKLEFNEGNNTLLKWAMENYSLICRE